MPRHPRTRRVSAGFRGLPENLAPMRKAGLEWDSSYASSVKTEANPCDLYGPFTYVDDGYEEILELPVHGWPDCTPKGGAGPRIGQGVQQIQYIVRWPSEYTYPSQFVKTPEEEFQVHKAALDAASRAGLPFCCLAFHPWTTVRKQDSEAKVIALLLRYANDQKWQVSTMDAEAQRCRENPELLWPAPEVPPQRTVGYDIGQVFA